MRRLPVVLVAVCCLCGVALAQAGIAIMSGTKWFPDGFFVGPRSANPTSARRNALTATFESDVLAYDFPSVAAGYCADSPSVSIPGAALGDGCVLAMDGDLTTGNPRAQFLCRVTAANTAVVRLCGHTGDGGATDVPDAGFTLRTFR